ncbi:MAG: acyl-CoA thioesterase II [Deltaproteobacteria bacterium]|nr:acyl-CoA thioesterase II [Deltaproteobacteria bacterium]
MTVPRSPLAELLSVLELERIEDTIFRGTSMDLGFGNIFGGQVLGQSLSAAIRTVPADRHVHSLHGYFMRPGDPARPIIYQVDCIRDGKSFTTRRVVAIQKGDAIFSMAASFQVAEQGFEHQDIMPDIPGPEGYASEYELVNRFIDRIPEPIRANLTAERPIEIRPIDPMNPFAPEKKPAHRFSWFRASERLPDDPMVHRYLLAYASDFGLIQTSMNPHGHTFFEPSMHVASLDHALWFQRDFRMDEWLLYAMHSPTAAGARGLNFGHIYDTQGRLVASIAQEGLIRFRG